MEEYTATYSPEDNKLRLYASSRLDSETYALVKAAGFRWAPKQELFVAPAWTPDREDLLLDLCGEIGDEDTSLVDRAEERAERFEDYSEKRADEAHRTHEAVSELAGGIPLGQPILVGHHSERRARKDAQRIENGMRKAVNLWNTSKYWTQRAAGALHHAKYKELPAVRARRIKGLEADRRKQERTIADMQKCLDLWALLDEAKRPTRKETGEKITAKEWAQFITNFDHFSTCFALAEYPREPPASQYEGEQSLWSALEDGIITAEQARSLSVPSKHRAIERATRWIAHLDNRLAYEKAMLAEQGAEKLLEKPKRPEQLPLCNYRSPEGINIENIYHRGEFSVYPQVEMTKAEYAKIYRDYKGTRPVEGSHRVRTAMVKFSLVAVFLTDSKVHVKPEPAGKSPDPEPGPMQTTPRQAYTPPERTVFDDMKDTLRNGGVQTVSAPQLFPTPPEVAAHLVELAEIEPGHSVLEPSAGTGVILKAIGNAPDKTAVEINQNLAQRLLSLGVSGLHVVNEDFLQCNGSLGLFDRIVMNPPFENGSDIKHIEHARAMLKPGGRLVAICANGPRQQRAFKENADYWEDLPAGTFKSQGTGVNTAILVINN